MAWDGGRAGTAFSKPLSVVLLGHGFNQQKTDWVGGFLVLH